MGDSSNSLRREVKKTTKRERNKARNDSIVGIKVLLRRL